ncbi:MAG TPA: hypothetical protein VFG96_05955, partial [Jiangellaceae bacterium]|nr:hypothetical protein [Jiangellaceae bacterium]
GAGSTTSSVGTGPAATPSGVVGVSVAAGGPAARLALRRRRVDVVVLVGLLFVVVLSVTLPSSIRVYSRRPRRGAPRPRGRAARRVRAPVGRRRP